MTSNPLSERMRATAATTGDGPLAHRAPCADAEQVAAWANEVAALESENARLRAFARKIAEEHPMPWTRDEAERVLKVKDAQ